MIRQLITNLIPPEESGIMTRLFGENKILILQCFLKEIQELFYQPDRKKKKAQKSSRPTPSLYTKSRSTASEYGYFP